MTDSLTNRVVLRAEFDIETGSVERRHRCEQPKVGQNRYVSILRKRRHGEEQDDGRGQSKTEKHGQNHIIRAEQKLNLVPS